MQYSQNSHYVMWRLAWNVFNQMWRNSEETLFLASFPVKFQVVQSMHHTLFAISGMGNYKESPVIIVWQRLHGLKSPRVKEGCRIFQCTAILRGFISLWNHTGLQQNSSADQMCLNRLLLSKVAFEVPSEQETVCESAFDNPHFWSIQLECALI